MNRPSSHGRRMRTSVQLHGDQDFDRPRRRAYPANPELRVQFHDPVSYRHIRGPYRVSIQLEAPVIEWGTNGRCWAFLADFDDESLLRIMADFRQATDDRRGAFGRPFGACP